MKRRPTTKSAQKLTPQALLRAMYRKLAHSWGPQHWWPAETPFEVIVGAILTQNTSWKNVERAMNSLRSGDALSPAGIRRLPLAELEQLVRSSGYYRQKAKRLKGFVDLLDQNYGGSLRKMFSLPTAQLRSQLLLLNGIGPETADAILLYAANREIFVVDTYTRRVLQRHAAIEETAKYEDIRTLVERALHGEKPISAGLQVVAVPRPTIHTPSPMSVAGRSQLAHVYNEMHGFFVQIGKHYCHRMEPNCQECPLRELLP